MSNIRVMLSMEVPKPSPVQAKPEAASVTIEDRVRDLIDRIDSGYRSDMEWILLNKLHSSLSEKRGKSKRIDNLLAMIEPIMAKYGYHKVSATK